MVIQLHNVSTYTKSVSSVEDLRRQHCTIGAKIEISSLNGLPKACPWSM